MPANLRLLASKPERTSDSYQMRFMHGLRAFSIYYVVFGHSTSDMAFVSANATYALQYMDSYESTLVAASFLSVDTFFFMRYVTGL
ncbi:hypothetical protein MTO96_003090 [Rhipicephalus appendiculatus]